MTMSVTVRKSSPVLVKPSEPVTMSSTVKLSSFDKGVIGVPVTSFFVFDQPIQEPAETIKRALSQAMVHYYPISGRVAAVADDVDPHIQCTGEGVLFVSASASSALKQVKLLELEQSPGAKALLDELALYYDPAAGGFGSSSDPLMMMQVTEFSCGGFVVGVTWNHAIADGYGMAQFLQAVGEIARGLSPPSVVPIRSDDSLPSLPPLTVALQQLLLSLEPMDFACLDITIPSSAINRIKAEYCISSGGQSSCTVFEVVTAVLWRCRTRAIMSNPEAPAVLSYAVNVRKHVGAKDGYYGNCVVGTQLVVATSGTVGNGDIIDVINLIKHTKDQIPHQFKRDGITGGSNQLPAVDPQQLDREVRYGMLALSSWRNLGFEEPDFGGGNPARVMYHTKQTASPLPVCVTCLPWKGMDGANLLSLCVKKEHADAFMAELSRFV